MNWGMTTRYMVDRLKERTTWVSIGTMLTGMGVAINPDQWQMIMAIGMGVGGILGILLPSRTMEKDIVPSPKSEPTTPMGQAMVDKVVEKTDAEKV